MKATILTIALCLSGLLAFGQEAAVDTIILVSGKRIPGKIASVSTSKVVFKSEKTGKNEDIPRKQMHKAIFANGRVEMFNKMAFEAVSDADYKAVILTENQADVEGLYALGNIEAKSGKSSRNAKSAERSASIKMQKKAAAMGGVYVLLTKNQAIGGYREVPTHVFEGVVYGFEPPEESK
ncbi:MAG: hypothetical protein IKI28_07520 [Bacteroidales bacterium]|nr:hypothetical protein [Bacteroidales bacterium]